MMSVWVRANRENDTTYRLATSVATRILRPPALNFPSAPSRALWLSCPCSGMAGNPKERSIIDTLCTYELQGMVVGGGEMLTFVRRGLYG